jgi:formylglycine-generating enzyme required for sulfatase activity
MFAAVPASIAHAQTACDADVDADGTVGAADLSLLLSVWGSCTGCNADVDNDGSVGAADLSLLLALWGGTCSQVPWATVLEAQPDPAVVTNVALRNAIIATGLPWRVRDDASQIEMVLVPPGTFSMGCSASSLWGCNTDESPVHAVTLSNAFYIGRYEVTQAQWVARMGSNPSYFQSSSAEVPAAQVPNRPVEKVSWNTIQNFLTATGLRLPTEAEWEYASRAGTTTAFHGFTGYPNGTNDDTLVGNIGWYDENSNSQTRPVGGKAANGYGLHDMSGNVWELVNDWYSSSFYAQSPSTNPSGPASGTFRVVRGGGVGYFTESVRSANRDFTFPGFAANGLGFRVARSPN